jgi:ADP-ribose pyrophosphatase YjhB (NUDIX family)
VGELDEWRYCPRCAAEIDVESGKAECPVCGFRAYASSKPTASAACIGEDGRVLMALRAIDPSKGRWDFPGGFVEEEERPLDCLRRELHEEARIEVEPLDFLGVWIDKYDGEGSATTTLNLYWRARVLGGPMTAGDDVAELRWFALDEIPDDELAFENTRAVVSLLRDEHA